MYSNNLALLTNNIQHLQTQIEKLQNFAEWALVDLNLTKCIITGSPNKAKLKSTIFKAYIQAQRILYKGKQFPILAQNEPYTYLSVQLVPSL